MFISQIIYFSTSNSSAYCLPVFPLSYCSFFICRQWNGMFFYAIMFRTLTYLCLTKRRRNTQTNNQRCAVTHGTFVGESDELLLACTPHPVVFLLSVNHFTHNIVTFQRCRNQKIFLAHLFVQKKYCLTEKLWCCRTVDCSIPTNMGHQLLQYYYNKKIHACCIN